MTPYNKILSQLYTAHITQTQNDTRLIPNQLDGEAFQFLNTVQNKAIDLVHEHLLHTESMSVDETANNIHSIGEQIYNEYCREKSSIKPKKPYIQDKIMEHINQRNRHWNQLFALTAPYAQPQWETILRDAQKRTYDSCIDKENYMVQALPLLPLHVIRQADSLWFNWDKQRRLARQSSIRDKKAYYAEIIINIGQPNGEENIWKAIKRLVLQRTMQ